MFLTCKITFKFSIVMVFFIPHATQPFPNAIFTVEMEQILITTEDDSKCGWLDGLHELLKIKIKKTKK